MRFIGNHPIPEHVNPPEEITSIAPVPEEENRADEEKNKPRKRSSGRSRKETSAVKPSERQAA